VLAVALLGAAAPAAPGGGCGSPEACFAGFVDRQRDVTAVRARFRQVKEIALLAAPLESRGRFQYVQGRGVRWEVEEPERMVVEIGAQSLRAGPPGRLREIEAGAPARVLEEMAALFTGRATPDSFDLSPGREADSVRLRPRDPSLARVVEEIEIAFDAAHGMPRWIRIDEVGGDRTRIEMSEVRVERGAESGREP
jgi:outer membrane lipoprotein-sorting protein